MAAIAIGLSLPCDLLAADPAPANAAKLATVVGGGEGWKFHPAEYVLRGDGDRIALTGPEGQALSMESNAILNPPCEAVVTFRFKPAPGVATSLGIQMACGVRTDKTPQSVSFSISNTSGQNSVTYSATVEGGKPPPPFNGALHFEAVSERSLAWSEEMRKAIEAQIVAAPKVADTLMTLRCTVEKGRFRIWLNGRFVNEIPLDADMNPAGTMRINLAPGTELVSVRIRPLIAPSRAFEPLSISGHLNAAPPNGKPLDPASLAGAGAAGRPTMVDGVPFQFPAPSAKGEDHLDVGQSWTRFGALPGWVAANSGTFGGRWVSADRVDPSRLALYVPPGRYKALHLIAVSDGRKDSVPVVSAQFYRPDAGHPINFSGTVPTVGGDAGGTKATPVQLAGGSDAGLHHIVIPLDPDSFSWFGDLTRIGMEITKQVEFFRAYPDPIDYSWHGAGLPSSVRIHAMTLERPGVDVGIQPDQYGHVWTAPATPSYTLELRNSTGAATTAKLVIATQGHGGKDPTRVEQEVPLPADGTPVKTTLPLKPTRYGLNELSVTVTAGGERQTYHRNFAWLHPNTREQATWEAGRGSIFGFWPYAGSHVTPTADQEIPVMAAAGAETSTANYSTSPPEIKALAEKHHFLSESAFEASVAYYAGFYSWYTGAPTFDPAKPEESGKALIQAMKKLQYKPSAICRPTFVPFFAEPNIGTITTGIWPSSYGEEYQLTKDEQAAFDDMRAKFLAGARAIRKEWPNLKLLLPYGDPMNTLVFLKLSPESRELIDGCAIDMPGFERMPEQQINQVTFSRLYPIMKELRQYKKDPYLMVIEGMCPSSKDIDTGEQGQANILARSFLLFMGYGVTNFEAGSGPFECAGYWGESHYGGGLCSRLPVSMPKLAYVNYATLTRHLNRANFSKYIPTGSTSTYCEQFKHYKTGKLIHVLWTIRGKRTVNIAVPPGASLEIFDQNDNPTVLKEKDGVVSFTVDQSPQYLEGLTADAKVTLGESDHSDARPAPECVKLSNLGDGLWNLVAKEDAEYMKNKPLQIERFLGKMSATPTEAPGPQGGKALSVHLDKQDKDRGVMPFYTTIEPKAPVTIPGKASHLGLWVRAASDWGRVVYVLRDAKGEKWVSVGTKEDWNNDDIHAWSAFCFDGWRYLRFELPGSAPYDSYREYGTTWWGSYGGDRVVDLPLKLEKILVERRPKVIYGNDLVEAKPDDVLLADLNAEYASAANKGDEAVRLSRLRMPAPEGATGLANPIAELAKTGVGAATKVLKVADPAYQYDGTRCHVHFEPVTGATTYDVWVGPYADGRGALQLGPGWTESGKLIEGLRPDVEFYAFVVYTDKDGKLSKPSAPLAFTLKNRFGYK